MDVLPLVLRKTYEARYFIAFALFSYLSFRLSQRIVQGYRIRRRYKDIKSLPRHPLWGNLVNCGERLKPSLHRHPDYGFEEIWNEMGQPSCFLLDLAPIDRAFLVVAEPQIAEAIVQPSDRYKTSAPKSQTYVHLKRLVGSESLVSSEGEHWRQLRKRFNPGFQPKHLYTLAGSVVSKTRMFVDRMKTLAESGAPFELAGHAQDLTTDIITELTIEKEFHAQSTPEGKGEKSVFGLLTASRRLSELCFKAGQGFNILHFLNPVRPLKAVLYEYVYDRKLFAIISSQINGLEPKKLSDKTITQLAVSGIPPSKSLVTNTVHQIKTFLFAGQDTTATMIQWMCYEMSKAPHSPSHAQKLKKLRAEHDAVFGAEDPFSAFDILSKPGVADSILGSKLPYTTAFVKETLRLHPPAATARQIPDVDSNNPPFEIDIDGTPARIDGLRIYISSWLVQRNPKLWGKDALAFNPDRWLDEEYLAKLPPGSWRPFERGPRNCIGQELAMLEGKVVLACVARAFEFEKVGLTGREVDGKLEREVWNAHNVTSVPSDGMRMRVKRVKGP